MPRNISPEAHCTDRLINTDVAAETWHSSNECRFSKSDPMTVAARNPTTEIRPRSSPRNHKHCRCVQNASPHAFVT